MSAYKVQLPAEDRDALGQSLRAALAWVDRAVARRDAVVALEERVLRELVPDDARAITAAAALGGGAAAVPLLERAFGAGLLWLPHHFVRLRQGRGKYILNVVDRGEAVGSVTFVQGVGWCRTQARMAVAVVRANELEPHRPPFDVELVRPEGRVVDVSLAPF